MTEEQNLPEVQPKDKDSIVPTGMAGWKVELGKMLGTWIAGGVSIGSLVTILNTTELPKIALGAAAGGGLTGFGAIVYALTAPMGKKIRKGAEVMGEGAAELAEDRAQGITDKVLGVDDRYLKLQKEDCQASVCDGIAQIFTPLLEEIFVPLSMTFTDRSSSWERCEQEEAETMASLNNKDAVIWQYLKIAEKSSTQGTRYRRMAILAWGGYGKTTLLRHIAYIYSSKQ